MTYFIVFLLLGACGLVGATIPHRRLGNRNYDREFAERQKDLYTVISRRAAFRMELLNLALLIALVLTITVLIYLL
jgi:cell division protein FtsL